MFGPATPVEDCDQFAHSVDELGLVAASGDHPFYAWWEDVAFNEG